MAKKTFAERRLIALDAIAGNLLIDVYSDGLVAVNVASYNATVALALQLPESEIIALSSVTALRATGGTSYNSLSNIAEAIGSGINTSRRRNHQSYTTFNNQDLITPLDIQFFDEHESLVFIRDSNGGGGGGGGGAGLDFYTGGRVSYQGNASLTPSLTLTATNKKNIASVAMTSNNIFTVTFINPLTSLWGFNITNAVGFGIITNGINRGNGFDYELFPIMSGADIVGCTIFLSRSILPSFQFVVSPLSTSGNNIAGFTEIIGTPEFSQEMVKYLPTVTTKVSTLPPPITANLSGYQLVKLDLPYTGSVAIPVKSTRITASGQVILSAGNIFSAPYADTETTKYFYAPATMTTTDQAVITFTGNENINTIFKGNEDAIFDISIFGELK